MRNEATEAIKHLGFAFSVFSKLVIDGQVRITQGAYWKYIFVDHEPEQVNKNFWVWGPFWKTTKVILLHTNIKKNHWSQAAAFPGSSELE